YLALGVLVRARPIVAIRRTSSACRLLQQDVALGIKQVRHVFLHSSDSDAVARSAIDWRAPATIGIGITISIDIIIPISMSREFAYGKDDASQRRSGTSSGDGAPKLLDSVQELTGGQFNYWFLQIN